MNSVNEDTRNHLFCHVFKAKIVLISQVFFLIKKAHFINSACMGQNDFNNMLYQHIFITSATIHTIIKAYCMTFQVPQQNTWRLLTGSVFSFNFRFASGKKLLNLIFLIFSVFFLFLF